MGAGVNKMIGDPCIFVRLIFVIKFICYFCIVFVKANRNRKSSKYTKNSQKNGKIWINKVSVWY